MTELGAVTARHDFDRTKLESYLQQNLAGFSGPLDIKQFQGGQSNPTYLLSTPERTYVMRSKPGPVSKLLPSAHAVEREFRVMSALAEHGVPVPRMLLLVEDELLLSLPYAPVHADGECAASE